jgi:hypothetical protein
MNETRISIAMQDASARDRALSKQRSVLAVFLLAAELVLLISACIIAVARPLSMDVTPAYSSGAFMVALVLAASMGIQALCARRCIAGGDGAKFATVVQTITLIIFAETACDAASEFSDRCCSNQRTSTEVSQTRSNFISTITSSNVDAYGRVRTGNARQESEMHDREPPAPHVLDLTANRVAAVAACANINGSSSSSDFSFALIALFSFIAGAVCGAWALSFFGWWCLAIPPVLVSLLLVLVVFELQYI